MPVKVKSLFISWRTIALALLLSVAAGLSSIAEPGAKRLFVDFLFDRRGADRDFPKMSAAIRRMGSRAVLAVEAKSADLGDSQLTRFPSPAFGTAAQLACIGWEYEFWQVWRLPTALNVNGRDIPTFSSLLANVRNPKVGTYALDLSYNTDTIRTYSAIDVISGQVGARELAGKDVIFAATATAYQDTHYLPGHDKIPGAFIHLIGGETLKRGQPIDIGWIPALALTAAALIGALAFRRTRHFNWIAVATGLGLIVVKVALMPMLVTVSIGASLFLIATISTNVARTSRRKSAQHENPVSGLPNFEALRTQASYGSATVIAAKVVNFEDLAAFIPGEGLSKLVEQVTRRLQLASQGTTLYHDLDGTFAWLVPYYQHSQIETQLMGLAALFNAPLTIDELKVDVSMAFGVNDEFEGSNAQRLAAALVAAEKSIRSRVLWTKYTPQQKDDAGWQLSFHSQLEDALNAGDIWVAFQPQYRIATRQLVGVEALVRWTHPTRGPISPDEFIVQAEKSQDIYRLTLFVMDQAIRSAAQLQKLGTEIHMSVNLSATLLDHKDLVSTIRVMLSAHHLPPERLTIEITETAQIENSLQARQTLAQIRRAGMRLSIDDYGTGQSNLEYLTEIEADEIKIDKRFVMTMRDSQRNLEVVKSTIDLAHRLGATAVAEGIEDAQTMALLDQLGCDIGQGYLLGKPQLIGDLLASLSPPSDSRRA